MTSVLLPALWLESIICHSRQVKVFNRCSFAPLGRLTFVNESSARFASSDPVNFFPPIQVLLLWKWASFRQTPHPLQPFLINLKFFVPLVSFLVLGAFHMECYRGHPAALDSLIFSLIHILVVFVLGCSQCLLGTCHYMLQGLCAVFCLYIYTPMCGQLSSIICPCQSLPFTFP